MSRCNLKIAKRIWKDQFASGKTRQAFQNWLADCGESECAQFTRKTVMSHLHIQDQLHHPSVLDEEKVRDLLPQLAAFVVCPIDKASFEGAIV